MRPANIDRCARALALLTILGTASACKDSGLPGRNTPEAEAAMLEGRYAVYESSGAQAARVYTMNGKRYLASAEGQHIPDSYVRPLSTADGQQLVALAWDREPFDRLYITNPDGLYHPLARIP